MTDKFKKIENAVSFGKCDEMFETSELGEPVYYPDTEETRETFKSVFEVGEKQCK